MAVLVFPLHTGLLQLRQAGAPLRQHRLLTAEAALSQSEDSGARRLQSLRLTGACGAWGLLFYGTWDLPRARIKPVSPALQVAFLTTGPPGKPSTVPFWRWHRGGHRYSARQASGWERRGQTLPRQGSAGLPVILGPRPPSPLREGERAGISSPTLASLAALHV